MSTGTGDEQERGREADVPSEIPRAGWWEVLVRVKDAIREDRITLIAAGVAFYAMLALFPAMIVVVSVYGLVMDPDEIAAQVRTLGVLPGDVRSILTGQLDALARVPSGRLSLSLAFGVLVALWSVSAGMKALVTGVNAAYSEAETRGFVRLRGLAVALTLGGSLVTVLALAVIVALPVAAERLPGPAGLLVSVLRWPLLAAVLIVGLAVLYRVAPSRKGCPLAVAELGFGGGYRPAAGRLDALLAVRQLRAGPEQDLWNLLRGHRAVVLAVFERVRGAAGGGAER
jgi:membrane protein